MALGYLYIYFWQFLSISGNLWKLILCIHQWYKSFWDMNLSFFPLFWGYKLHFQPINLQKFNLKKTTTILKKKTNHSHLDLTLAHKMNIRFTKISQSPSRLSVRAWNTIKFLSFTCIFWNFQKFISAKLFGISEISCYHLKGDSEYFLQKNQRCPKSTHKLPISPFSKYHRIP